MNSEDIDFLTEFRQMISDYLFLGYAPTEVYNYFGSNKGLFEMKEALKRDEFRDLRQRINESKGKAARLLTSCDIGTIMVQYPPPAVGGAILRIPLFDLITQNTTHENIETGVFTDKIDEAIGLLRDKDESSIGTTEQKTSIVTTKGFVFIAMAIDPSRPELDDVLDAIKEASISLSLNAERIDEDHSTERITDRILDSIEKAEFVIADLTYSKPNVYYEAGYAHALEKTPIYIARDGTNLEFDIKDFPVIFFSSMRELKAKLTERFEGLLKDRLSV